MIYVIEVGGDCVEVTDNHPFWVISGTGLALRGEADHVYECERRCSDAGRWVDSEELAVGDQLLLFGGETGRITAISSYPGKIKVYNLTVGEYHNYAVTDAGVLVHNRAMKNFDFNPPNGDLDWSIVKNSTGETRYNHIQLHGADNINKPFHGVFDADPVISTQEAWYRAQRLGINASTDGSLTVPMGRPVGWQGGYNGAGETLNNITIITTDGNKIITAFPSK